MADFFKGLSGGFQTGLQISEALRAKQERERLREAMGLTPQEMQQRQATPEEFGRAQAETQGLAAQDAAEFGLAPQEQAAYAPQMPVQGQRIGASQYGLGGQTFDRMPTQQEIQQARYGAMADVIAERDPARAMQMRQQLEEQAYQAKVRPLQLQSLEGQIAGQGQQRELTGLQLTRGKRDEAASARGDAFSAYAAERPEASVAELKDAAFKQFKFSPKQWEDVVTTRLNIDKADLSLFKSNIQKKLQGKSLTQLGTLYNTDSDFDDKTDLAIVPGKGGAVTLNFIDKASGKVTGSQAFKNEALATEYLNKQATEPETIGSWMMNLRKAETGIEADQSAIRLRNAQAGEVGKSAVEKNLATLQRLGIAVSPEDVRAMAGIKQDKLSPEAAARLEVITASVKGNDSPKALAEAQAEITNLFKGEALSKRNATIVRGLQTANSKKDLPAAIKQLQDAGVGDETIVGLARQAGVTLPSNFAPAAPAAAPAATPRGVATSAAPAEYVPPANSPAGRALAARQQGLVQQSEATATTARAQSALSAQFAADSKVLSPLQMAQKYDAVRRQLPVADATALQLLERNIR